MRTAAILFIGFIFFSQSGFAQADSLPVRLAGVIYSDDSIDNAPFVHIINLRTGRGTISDSIGFFKITMQLSDTLIFRCLGFDEKQFVLPDTIASTILFIEVKLTGKSYFLDVIDILALSRINQFKYDFTNMEFPKDTWEQQFIIPGVTREKYQWIRDDEKYRPAQIFNGPIGALYMAFSDEGESLRKYAELMKNEESNRLIDEKYNLKLLREFTGLTGDTLIDFRLYLNFSRSYLLNTNGYDILVEVKRRQPAFLKGYPKKD